MFKLNAAICYLDAEGCYTKWVENIKNFQNFLYAIEVPFLIVTL